jgi:hypothetical protein
MVMLKPLPLIFAAFALGGCCLSGNGCYAPSPGIPTAWDGAGPAPRDPGDPATVPRKRVPRSKTEIVIGPIDDAASAAPPKLYSKEYWAQKDAASRADDAQLAKQMMICRGCAVER